MSTTHALFVVVGPIIATILLALLLGGMLDNECSQLGRYVC